MVRSSSSPRKKRNRKAPRRRRWRIPFVSLGIIITCAAAAWLLWLDYQIHSRFEGQRWTLPARVYARPFEVHAGQRLDPSRLEAVLKGVGYEPVTSLEGPGQYRRQGDRVEIYRRRFRYWDGVEEPGIVRVTFAGSRVGAVEAVSGGGLPGIMRIEPQLIAKIYPEHREDRVPVPLDEVPPALVHALLAVEDRRFFEHSGIDLRGIARAAWANLRAGRIVEGGSTLTQQLVKNFYLTDRRTFARKIHEIAMALLLERRYSKEEILGAYINEVYLGQHGAQGVHGFGTAAQFYFGRPLAELRVDQLALLAGLVRGASYYNPYRHPERALERRNLVLDLMQEQGYLDAATAAAAQRRPLGLAQRPRWTESRFPAFTDLVRRQLLREYRMEDLRNAGLQVFTTLDPELQERAEKALRSTIAALERDRRFAPGTLQAAAVIVEPGSGDVVAAIGGVDSQAGGFNRSLDARRPIGSLVKPFVYLAALSQPGKFHVLSRLDDSPLKMKGAKGRTWEPRNYDRNFHGTVTLMEALLHSYNVATVRLGLAVGIGNVIDTLHRAGVDTPISPLPSVLLGALELSPFQVAQAYQVLANGGFLSPLNSIQDVLDAEGRGLKRYGIEVRQAFDPQPVFLTNYLLMRVTTEGTGAAMTDLLPDRLPLAGKTGTTNDLRDSWFAGFGEGYAAVVWVGRDDNRPVGLSGATGAMRVWAAMMKDSGLGPFVPAAPQGIAWTGRVSVPYRGECRRLATVPYAAPHVPDVGPGCEAFPWQ